ncbi:MutT/nudix family protein [Parvularcula bermudensis HTCC2503]|uniref:GDP-mannose pyrophosphatase n=1 Tax=Parvularcula bermudensis (strain ATCC BAA-594 / HTCC2503 / KCTC 12087) TaxID=314260 RepID=E0TBU1_PARBH|nr:NUDIX hydrolase [Parvularcula bermudensis]ADM08434.1 MutT/nudix family protein [Parvularcula bermudensis HTCC2503]
MEEVNGPWRITARHTAYETPWIRIEHHDVVRPDGADSVYGVVRFKNLATGVLPLFADGTTILVGQHRFPFNTYSWELPEGGAPAGEAPHAAALRELEEEAGLVARHWTELGQVDLSNSVSDERAFFFLAWELGQGKTAPDPDEVLETKRVPLAEVIQMCLAGEIRDSLTHLMILTAVTKARLNRLPTPPQDLILAALDELSS